MKKEYVKPVCETIVCKVSALAPASMNTYGSNDAKIRFDEISVDASMGE